MNRNALKRENRNKMRAALRKLSTMSFSGNVDGDSFGIIFGLSGVSVPRELTERFFALGDD